MSDLEIIILAAGKGTRMNQDQPKVLVNINGQPMLKYILTAVSGIQEKKPLIILGYKADEVKNIIGPNNRFALQDKQLGTGHAVKEALKHLPENTKHVIVLYGDHPLIKTETIHNIYHSHIKQNKSPITMATINIPDFNDWRKPFYDFGRIVRNTNGQIIKNIEKKDANATELEIKELNPSYFCYDYNWLKDNINKIENKNAQGEYYLTDLVGMAHEQGYELNSCPISAVEALGVNTIEQLNLVETLIKNN